MDAEKTCRQSVILLHNAMIVTVDSQNRVFRNGGLVVDGDKITAIGQSPQILRDFSASADEIVDLQGRILLPGFINTHVHTSQQLARGIADDVDLMTWLHGRIWPYESSMTEEDSYISTLLCGIELIHSGVTCFAEAGGQHVSEMARAVELLGIRACLTQSTMDSGEGLPANWSIHTTDYCIQSQKDLYKKHHDTADGRIRVWFGLRQIMNATDRLLLETRDVAKELNTGIHMIGFLSRAGVKVSHCPAAAMRMLGFAPIKEMLESGICISLGTDGAPSNNRMSIVDEMFLASLVNKGREAHTKGTTDPTAVPAETVLQMVTVNGAKSVLWDNEIGSLEIGKKADMIIVNPFSWSMVPLHDCISSLVYCMRTENIDSVMCNGRWIMKNQKILTVNEATGLEKGNDMLKWLAAQNFKEPAKMRMPNTTHMLKHDKQSIEEKLHEWG
ncbi:uncharacterized protein LOC131239385 isoform X3 [Magnolia sinica]|uniref:uncharacterized protein LOC131239385 isoform X3 n=1 Tax=Magnolia sinica TaxID=86752 RepID=UPI002659858C|nr:uncharacterized protein LOC131239385 isoform X3 [Magnolia sinica]